MSEQEATQKHGQIIRFIYVYPRPSAKSYGSITFYEWMMIRIYFIFRELHFQYLSKTERNSYISGYNSHRLLCASRKWDSCQINVLSNGEKRELVPVKKLHCFLERGLWTKSTGLKSAQQFVSLWYRYIMKQILVEPNSLFKHFNL